MKAPQPTDALSKLCPPQGARIHRAERADCRQKRRHDIDAVEHCVARKLLPRFRVMPPLLSAT